MYFKDYVKVWEMPKINELTYFKKYCYEISFYFYYQLRHFYKFMEHNKSSSKRDVVYSNIGPPHETRKTSNKQLKN